MIRSLVAFISIVLPSVVLLSAMPSVGISAEPARKPNVLMICIDDLNDWTGFLGGHPDVKTPHLDALARRGLSFTNAHCSVPVCSASRVSVMSGVAPTTHGSYELGPRYEELPALADVPTIHRYFHENGYLTISGGKVLHHDFRGRLANDVDRSLGRTRTPRPKHPLNRPDHWSGAWDWGRYPKTDNEMADAQLAKQAAKVFEERFDKPFFFSVGFFRPHVPLFVPAKWFELYDETTIHLPSTQQLSIAGIPSNFLRINEYAAAPTHAEVIGNNKQRSLTQAYLASISFVDDCVGHVLNALKNSPYMDNTLVVLWSDHGFHLGEKKHWAKRTLWEESTKVPFLFAGPKITPGTTCDQAVSLLDLYPTLVDLCELPSNPHLEGVSLAAQIESPTTPRKQPAITSSYFGNHSIRTRDWRLISYNDGKQELYNHQRDPEETHNLADQPEFQSIKTQLLQWLPQNAAPEFKTKSERPDSYQK